MERGEGASSAGQRNTTGEIMKDILAVTAGAVVIAAGLLGSGAAHAQTKPIEAAPPQAREMDPAKRVPPPAQPAPETTTGQQAVPAAPATAAQPAAAATPHYTTRPSWEDVDRGGFF